LNSLTHEEFVAEAMKKPGVKASCEEAEQELAFV